MKPSREQVRRYKAHLNATFPTAGSGKCGTKTGSTKRPYGDYLYAQDRAMFMWELTEAILQGRFK